MKRLHKPLYAIAIGALIPGCASNRSTFAVLHKTDQDGIQPASVLLASEYKQQGEQGFPYAGNVIFVPAGSRFSISTVAINPGWISEGIDSNVTAEKLFGRNEAKLKTAEAKLARDRNLWLVWEINSEDKADPLRLNSKKIIHTSFVKYDVGSFGLIPVDFSESEGFALEANNAYQVKVTVYDIQNLDLKRIAVNGLRESPGVSTIIKNTWDTSLKTVQSFVGDALVNGFRREFGEEQAIERVALLLDAEKEFQATFSVYRKKPEGDLRTTTNYALIDASKQLEQSGDDVKLAKTPHLKSPASYLTHIGDGTAAPKLDRLSSFVIISVSTAKSPEVELGAGAPLVNPPPPVVPDAPVIVPAPSPPSAEPAAPVTAPDVQVDTTPPGMSGPSPGETTLEPGGTLETGELSGVGMSSGPDAMLPSPPVATAPDSAAPSSPAKPTPPVESANRVRSAPLL